MSNLSPNSEPTFWLDEDGSHVWWKHDCLPELEKWRKEVGFKKNGHPLPIGPEWWITVQTDLLTVTPSILCPTCGTHGFITNGKWVRV